MTVNQGVYGFEGIDGTLPFLPLAARRALDRLGRKLSLEGWLSLPLLQRWRIVLAGAGEVVDPEVAAAALEGAVPAATMVEPLPDPERTSVPDLLRAALAALAPPRALDDARWRELGPLDRYALVKCAGKPEKLGRAYDAIAGVRLTHLTGAGEAHMVDVGGKTATARRAIASALVRTTPQVIQAIAGGALAKGDVLGVARVAGILASKRTPELIPLCHPVQTTSAAVDFEPSALRGELRVRATVEAVDRTGVEMEAMVAASVASLTVYDMIKSADRWASVEAVRLEEKSGGKSGTVRRPQPEPLPPADSPSPAPWVELVEGPPSVDEAIARVKHPGAGAICAFLGIVRDHNDGRAVTKLEYEAYPAMAMAEMIRIAREIAGEGEMEGGTKGVRLAVLHRIGSLVVGDVAVVCAASAPHRGEAYQACRALIDRVKARVPIWKREHGPEGAYWVGWQDARCEPDHGGHHH